MAFVVAKGERFEIRESHATSEGPRSRTLATFTELTDDVVEKALGKASKPFDAGKLREAARRAGAPVVSSPADHAARELIAALAQGHEVDPRVRGLLLDALRDWEASTTRRDAVRGAAEWLTASPQSRAKTLVDLLLLADALPSGAGKKQPLRFPRLHSAPS